MKGQRRSTNRKILGRAQLISSIRIALDALGKAASGQKEPAEAAQLSIEALQRAAQWLDIYKVDRKRVKIAVNREIKHLTELLEVAKSLPITVEEKAIAKMKWGKEHDKQVRTLDK